MEKEVNDKVKNTTDSINPIHFGRFDMIMINRGNCMLCGKRLTEGLFFCKECEEKGRK